MRNSPKEFTVRFGELRGKAIRGNYRSTNFESVVADGQAKSRMIFKIFTEAAISYAYRSPTALFSETQFIQSTLGAPAEVMPIESLLSIVPYYGMTMRVPVERETEG
ncbi:hypothetical protein B9Z19DRAFT_1123642 [Tuber borchii]|uniref:Uncharacterized protein n=1 Tax=Tuber borchii TaxID=42251 RepID=A0A2T6ZY60_TUBBO|nr:hypothetical protein B9Z19DRAFT_1123642 [Tuber borchii]